MKKLLLFAAAAVCALSLSAKKLYLSPNMWTQDDAVFFVHTWASETDFDDVQLTKLPDGETYYSEAIKDAHPNCLFVRMPAGSTSIVWDGEGKYWNKTGDLEIPCDGAQYVITGWGNDGVSVGEWAHYDGGGEGEGGEGGSGEGGSGFGNSKDYYLKGYRGPTQGDITTPTAEEQFENGVLTYSFEGKEGKGYFFVLVCEAGQVVGDCYMAAAYTEDTHCTLFKQDDTHQEKMGVAAPSATFYLYDNGNGTLELSTQPMEGKTLVGGGSGEGGEGGSGEGGEGGEGGGEEQAIENVAVLNINAPMFDVLGRQVTEEYHGIVIQNGHKFIR